MSTTRVEEEHKAIAHYWYQAAASGHVLDLYDRFLTPDFVDHSPYVEVAGGGHEAAKRTFADQFGPGASIVRVTVEDLIAEGDKVAARIATQLAFQGDFMGVPVAGKTATLTAIDILRFWDKKIAEHWAEQDLLGLLQQLGIISALTAGHAPR